jgi:hypothetical protein
MFTPDRTHLRPVLAFVAVAILAACSSIAAPTGSDAASPSGPIFASPGDAFGSFPGVDGFGYVAPAAPGVERFIDAANASLDADRQIEVVDAALATRGEDEVLAIAFGVPGTTDEEAVDAFARILDGMEDGFQAGSQRGLGGSAYVMSAAGETVVLGPWGRTDDYLVFLFSVGPTGATEDFASAILDPEG